MNSKQEGQEGEKSFAYVEIPCAHCGLHYWKIPNKKGQQLLKCPKCNEITRVEIGTEFNIYII
jgi:phage FluMu protein Com